MMELPDKVRRQRELAARIVARLSQMSEHLEGQKFDCRDNKSDLEEMHYLEGRMIDDPPYVQHRGGLWIRQPTGFNARTLAQRKAKPKTGLDASLSASTVDGELNPETDLVPEYLVPSEVVMPDGSKWEGQRWADEHFKDAFPKPKIEVTGVYRIPMSDWGDIIDHREGPDLNRNVEIILNQSSVGSCAAEGEAGSSHTKADSMGYQSQGSAQDVAPQPYFLYSVTSGGVDAGSNPRDNYSLMKRLGCCTQKVRPRSVGWRRRHSQEELEDAAKHKLMLGLAFPTSDVELLGSFLFTGTPVGAGYPGHWWYAIDMLSRNTVKWVNSWGPGWADGGKSTISTSRLTYELIAKIDVMDASQILY